MIARPGHQKPKLRHWMGGECIVTGLSRKPIAWYVVWKCLDLAAMPETELLKVIS